jgi:hypothetical protein
MLKSMLSVGLALVLAGCSQELIDGFNIFNNNTAADTEPLSRTPPVKPNPGHWRRVEADNGAIFGISTDCGACTRGPAYYHDPGPGIASAAVCPVDGPSCAIGSETYGQL